MHSRCPLGQACGKELCEFFVRGFVFEAIVDGACAIVAGRPWALDTCWGILLDRHGVSTLCASVCCWRFNGVFSRYRTNSRCERAGTLDGLWRLDKRRGGRDRSRGWCWGMGWRCHIDRR